MAIAMKAALRSSLNVQQVKWLLRTKARVRGALREPGHRMTCSIPFAAHKAASWWVTVEFTVPRYYEADSVPNYIQ